MLIVHNRDIGEDLKDIRIELIGVAMDSLTKVRRVSGKGDKVVGKEEEVEDQALEEVDPGKIGDLLMMTFLVILHLVCFFLN